MEFERSFFITMRDVLEGLAIERKHFVQTFEPEKEPQENVAEQQQNQGRLKEQQQLVKAEDPLKPFEGLTLSTNSRFKPCLCPVTKDCNCESL